MAGKRFPVVLIPRYSTYAGANDFTTIGMEVTPFSSALITIWRNNLIGSSPTCTFEFEESTDRTVWTTCSGGGTTDPGADTQQEVSLDLRKRYLRAKVSLGGGGVAATLYAIGYFTARTH